MHARWGRAELGRMAYGHALADRIPLEPGTAADLDRVLAAAATAWWGDSVPRPRLWIEHVDAESSSRAADDRVAAELHRAMGIDGPLLRVVLVTYTDGVADLVVVADRRDLDRESLDLVLQSLCGKRVFGSVAVANRRVHDDGRVLEPESTQTRSRRDDSFDWAIGDELDGTGCVTVPVGVAPADAVAIVATAAGLVLGKYDGRDEVRVATWNAGPARPSHTLGGFETCAVVTIDAATAGARRHADDAAGVRIGVLGSTNTVVGQLYLACQAAPFPLTIEPIVAGGELALRIHHQRRVVGTASATQFAGHVARLVRGGTGLRGSDVDLSDESTTAPMESASLRSRRIDAAFRDRARAQPDAPAVVHGHRVTTYEELAELADRLTSGLRAQGVCAGDRVGICLERSVDLVATMLAVLAAGAAYVPMDTRHPAERLAYTAVDADVRLIVADDPELFASTGIHALRAGDVDSDDPSGGAAPADANDPAYVIYTSGSTGRPKGVVVPHRNVHALLDATAAEFDLGPDDTWTLFHSAAFDFSVWEIWGALLTGGRLVVVPYWISRSPIEFHTLLAAEQVTVLSQTPSAFAHLAVADRELDRLDALRLVIFGGESLDTATLAPWLDRYPETQCRLVNMYGTTETTVHVTARTVTRRDVLDASKSVGVPIPGWSVVVLDEHRRRVPPGVVGEIYVGGAGVAIGYLNRPGLTSERFVAVESCGGTRMYRTGDRGRLRPGGSLDHLGRLDTQVQIRGFRVELDEVRAVLLDDPAVAGAAVITTGRPEDPGGIGIDAFVVLTGDDTGLVRQRAAHVLPEHMLPSSITALTELPLTINGKLDVARLPTPQRTTPDARREPAARAGDSVAQTLTNIWESLLGVSVGVDDNLFELGGNSLCAIKADAMMRRLGLQVLPMRELYLRPSIRGICETLERLYPPDVR